MTKPITPELCDVKGGKLFFRLLDGSSVCCECIGEPYASQIVASVAAARADGERIGLEKIQELIDVLIGCKVTISMLSNEAKIVVPTTMQTINSVLEKHGAFKSLKPTGAE